MTVEAPDGEGLITTEPWGFIDFIEAGEQLEREIHCYLAFKDALKDSDAA